MRHPSSFADTVAVLEEVFRPCLVMGQVVRAHRRAPSRAPDPFPATVCDCSEERSRVVSFWVDDRLWCVDFCFHCSLGRPTGALQSLARSDLPEGFLATHTVVADTRDKPFLVDEGQAVWKNALVEAGMADWREQERAEIWEAAAEHFACGNGPMTQGSRSHFRGAPAWIQWPIHPAPACPRCQAPMVFLAQLAEDLGFHWGDAGDAYVFHCPDHPEHGHVEAQTH